MKLKKLFLLCIALIVSLTAGAQFREGASYEELYDSETVAAVKSHVRELSANHLEGRKPGSEGEKYAAEYVAAKTCFRLQMARCSVSRPSQETLSPQETSSPMSRDMTKIFATTTSWSAPDLIISVHLSR